MDQFSLSHQNFAQNSPRNSKIIGLKILVKKWQKIAQFRALKSIFEFNVFIGYFGMFQGFKKATPYGCAWKLRLSRPSVRCVIPIRRSSHMRKCFHFIIVRIFMIRLKSWNSGTTAKLSCGTPRLRHSVIYWYTAYHGI